jgi:hypothetical protein
MSAINLADTSFVLSSLVGTDWEPQTSTLFKGRWSRVNNFGTLLIGWDEHDPFVRDVCGLDVSASSTPPAPVFCCPDTWRMPQILRALGAFQSAGEASRNGWNRDVPEGFSEHFFKLNRIPGSLCVFKKIPEMG